MLEVGVAHVEERLPGHGGVFYPVFLGEEGQGGVHQRSFSRRARALHDARQRLVEEARGADEVEDEGVGVLAHQHAAQGGAKPSDQVGGLRPGQRGRALLGREHEGGRDLLGGPGQFGLGLFDGEEQARHVAAQKIDVQAGFLGRAFDEAAAFAVAGQIERVEVVAGRAALAYRSAEAQAQGDLERVGAEGLFEPADAVFAAVQVEEPVFPARRQRGR